MAQKRTSTAKATGDQPKAGQGQPAGKGVEYRLPDTKRRMVLALVGQREEIAQAANREIAGINAAIDELARELAATAGLPDKGGRLVFQQRGQGALALVFEPEPEKAKPAPEEKEPADEPAGAAEV
jgi:hypothetical protein